MGLLTGGINEVIATTSFNAAPMGIRYADGFYTLTLFSGSHTATNIERDGWLVANLVSDPMLYVQTAFEDPGREAFCEEHVAGNVVHRLRCADAWIAFSAIIDKKTTEALHVRLFPEKECLVTPGVRPVNRGFNSIIEASVHATRYVVNRDPSLKWLICHHAVIVRKCGGQREREALDLLLNFIKE